jgi:SAM-dependent methyltransferase
MGRDWNKAYEEADTPWDKGYGSPPLADFLGTQSVVGRVLVPGCGTGHDVRLLAGRGAEAVGMDIAPGALRKAESFPRCGNERYVLGDILNAAGEHCSAYDWLFEHTCLCAIDPGERPAYAEALVRVLKPGAHFLAVFFREVGRGSDEGPPFAISREESDALFADRFELLNAYVPKTTYPSRPIGAEEVALWRLK